MAYSSKLRHDLAIFWLQYIPYVPYSINLQIFKFLLKFSIKFSHKGTPIVEKCGPNHIQKENFKNFVIYHGKFRPKGRKIKEKAGDPLPVYSAPPSKS